MTTLTAAPQPEAHPARRGWIARHPLPAFFALALAISWLVVLPPLLSSDGFGLLPFALPFKPFQTIAAYGPFVAAFLVAAAGGRPGVDALIRRMANLRVSLGWYAVAVFGYVLLDLLIGVLVSGEAALASFAQNWPLIFTLYLPLLLTTRLINPIGEETGWTGFGLPHVQRKFGPLLGAIVLGVGWGLWHLPAYFVPSEMGAFNPIVFIFLLVSQISTRVIWTWIGNKTQASVPVGVLLHASANTASLDLVPRLFPSAPPEAGLIAIGVTLLTAIVVLIFTRGRLAYDRSD